MDRTSELESHIRSYVRRHAMRCCRTEPHNRGNSAWEKLSTIAI